MKKLALLGFVGVAIFAATSAASAQYGPGYIGPRYYRDYDDSRAYRRDQERYRDDERRHYRRAGPCPRGYTVQDGVCKPYRGY